MKTILLDLDGTITDPAAGIIGAYLHALRELALDAPPAESLRWVIGPSLRSCFPKLIGPERDVEEAVRLYRAYYGTKGMLDALIYPGMEAAMTAMRRLPARVLICTAKPAHFAVPIMRHFGLEPHCDAIYGPELDGRLDDKGDLIAHMLEAERFDPRQTVMIGDRGSDMIAASRHGIAGVGVLWGYGDADELSKAGAAVLCADPRELVASATSLLRGR